MKWELWAQGFLQVACFHGAWEPLCLGAAVQEGRAGDSRCSEAKLGSLLPGPVLGSWPWCPLATQLGSQGQQCLVGLTPGEQLTSVHLPGPRLTQQVGVPAGLRQ